MISISMLFMCMCNLVVFLAIPRVPVLQNSLENLAKTAYCLYITHNKPQTACKNTTLLFQDYGNFVNQATISIKSVHFVFKSWFSFVNCCFLGAIRIAVTETHGQKSVARLNLDEY